MTESQRIAELYAKQHSLYERRMYPIFLNVLRAQIQPVIDWIINMKDVNPPLDLLIDTKIFRPALIRSYQMIGITAAKREYYYMKGMEEKSIIEFLIDKWRSIFTNYAINYSYQIENELSETTKEEIRKALAYAYENNYNADRTATLIRRSVQGQISRTRALLIARTEATTASNLGKEAGAREWGAEFKQFIGREDNRERHTHVLLNDTIIPINDSFIFGGVPGSIPGDVKLPAKERIRCRCTVIYLTARTRDRLLRQGD